MAKYGDLKLYGDGHLYGGLSIQPPVLWTGIEGGNHLGQDWLIEADAEVSGVHYNVGRFLVADAVTLTVRDYDGSGFGTLEVRANDIEVAGAIIGSGAGFRGGGATEPGEGPYGGAPGVDGGYMTGAGQGDATTDDSVVGGSGGGGSASTSAAGGDGGAWLRLVATSRLYVPGSIYAHGYPGGDVTAGNGAGGGILLDCDGPLGVDISGMVGTLGGGTEAGNGGSVKMFTAPGMLDLGGAQLAAGRLFPSGDQRRGMVLP